jgi:2-dehydro-3-deoxy-L-rhamnonate dehydrogenase (NAD+)
MPSGVLIGNRCGTEGFMAARFAGRTAIVTGGVSGIGAGIAARLTAEGARVSLWDRDTAALAKADAAHQVSIDVTDTEAVQRAADETAAALGRIDILIACAGITGPNAPTWDYPVAEWDRVIDVNLNGVFYCNRAIVPHMRRRDYGRIVNIASIAGKEGNPNAAAYSASKAGVIGLTKSLGKELANTNVRVNCVTPAAVRTPLFAQMTQDHIDFMLSKIPAGRFGEIEEIASLVCWLASEECSFSTGGVFDISGGRATY